MYDLSVRHLLWRMMHADPTSRVLWPEEGVVRHSDFHEVARDALRVAKGLGGLGIVRGSRVVGMGWNSVEYLQTTLAVPSLGGVLDHINFRLAPEEITRLIAQGPVGAAVLDAHLFGIPDLHDSLEHTVEALTRERVPLVIIGAAGVSHETDIAEWIPFASLARGESMELEELPPYSENDVAFVLHSGGTTGSPKSFQVSHRASLLHALAQGNANSMAIRTSDRVLPLPQFFHGNAWNIPFVTILAGADLVLPGRDSSGSSLARLLRDSKVTLAAGVPTLWHDICASIEADPTLAPSDLREVICSGSVLTDALAGRIRDGLGAAVVVGWGMTEAMGTGTYRRDASGTGMGRTIPLLEMRADVDHEASGELEVRGPVVIGGEGGWYGTGDIARIEGDGTLTLLDRQKDVIKSGGEWISSLALETAIAALPGVLAVAVVARPDERWGERPVAVVQMASGAATPSLGAVRRALAGRFPKWWVPDAVTSIERLPLTRLGKVDKIALRRELAGRSEM